MGNSSSKKAQLEAAEKNYAEATSNLAIRDKEFTRVQKELELSKTQGAQRLSEVEVLRKKCAELDALSTGLEQERQRQIARLQSELKQKGDEILAQRQAIELRTQERDDTRRTAEQMEENIKLMEQKSQMSSQDFDRRRKELEDSAQVRSTELEAARTQSALLTDKVRLLEERYEVLSVEFATAKAVAEEKLEAARAVAAEELSVAKANATQELETAKASMSESARNLTSVSGELASTKAALSSSRAKYGDLQRTHNESVSRRTASYEAFTATKQELVEAQEKYMTLYKSHEKQGLDIEVAKKELRDEREVNDRLRAELGTLQRRLADGETQELRMTVPAIKIQEVTVA